MQKNKNLFITEISEEDFRKLNLTGEKLKLVKDGEKRSHYEICEFPINEMLDENIEYLINSGYESCLEDLKKCVAIFYYKKGVNYCTHYQTSIALGVKHLYSTRDYYISSEDGERYSKKDLKSVYFIHLDNDKYISRFVLKHKKEFYKELKGGWKVYKWLKLNEETNEWELDYMIKELKTENCLTTSKYEE